MQIEDGTIRCLSGTLTRIGEELTGEVKRVGNSLSGTLTRIGEELIGYVSLVCTTNRSSYLIISKDTLWLTPDMLSEKFDIYSNVIWKID